MTVIITIITQKWLKLRLDGGFGRMNVEEIEEDYPSVHARRSSDHQLPCMIAAMSLLP